MAHLVFVFGTLKEGFPNFHVNHGRRVPGLFRTRERWPLYLVGDRQSPWMIEQPGHGHRVLGQLFEVDDAALGRMDGLERVGEPDGYRRCEIAIEAVPAALPQVVRRAFAYLKPPAQLLPTLPRSGPLPEYTAEHARGYRARGV